MLGWPKCCRQTTKVQGPRGRQSCRALEWRLLLPRESYGTACLPETSVHLCWSCYRLSLWESGSSAERHLCGSVVGPGQVGRTTSPGPPVRGSCPPSFGWGLPQSPGWRGCVTQAMLCVLDVESTCILCRCGCLLPRGCLARQSQLGVPTLPESDPVAACWLGTQANQWSPEERTVRAGGPPIPFPSGISPHKGEIGVSATLGLVLGRQEGRAYLHGHC